MNPNVFGQLISEGGYPFQQSHVNEVLIDGVWHTYKVCQSWKEGVNPNDLTPPPKLRFLAAGVFEHRCNGVIQDRLTRSETAFGEPYTPEPRIYWA